MRGVMSRSSQHVRLCTTLRAPNGLIAGPGRCAIASRFGTYDSTLNPQYFDRKIEPQHEASCDNYLDTYRGTISKVITSEIEFKGYKVHASKDEPQYEIKSDKTDHIAMHKGSALTKLSS